MKSFAMSISSRRDGNWKERSTIEILPANDNEKHASRVAIDMSADQDSLRAETEIIGYLLRVDEREERD